ncbi:MAG: ABC transporter substrate-binding protein [Anaerolineae bacterium]|nr:ABC transporter substrate-binding protein [Anaerolineae bacterium]
MTHARMKKLLLAAVAMALVTVTACGSEPGTAVPTRPVIKLAISPWVASEVNATVAKILLEEQMGYTVEIVPIDEYAQWEAMAKGEVHAGLEVWPSGHAEDVQKYIVEAKTVEDGGPLGPVGKITWYIPSYLRREHPELATWEGLKDPDNVALFATAATGTKGQFLAGDPSWVQYDEQIINNLGLNFQVVRLDSEEKLLAALDAAYQKQEPILLYFWTPHWAHSLYDLVPVELPAYSEECYARAAEGGVDCDYPPDPLFKIFWSGFKDYAPQAYAFLKRMSYTNLDQIAILATVQLDKKSVEEAARAWIAENEEVWKGWIP